MNMMVCHMSSLLVMSGAKESKKTIQTLYQKKNHPNNFMKFGPEKKLAKSFEKGQPPIFKENLKANSTIGDLNE